MNIQILRFGNCGNQRNLWEVVSTSSSPCGKEVWKGTGKVKPELFKKAQCAQLGASFLSRLQLPSQYFLETQAQPDTRMPLVSGLCLFCAFQVHLWDEEMVQQAKVAAASLMTCGQSSEPTERKEK